MFWTLPKINFYVSVTFILSSANAFNLNLSKVLSLGKELTHYHTLLHFDALKICSCGNIVRKGEIACNKQFLLLSQCFLPYMVLMFRFKCTFKCRLQFVPIWTSLRFCRLVIGSHFFQCMVHFLVTSSTGPIEVLSPRPCWCLHIFCYITVR